MTKPTSDLQRFFLQIVRNLAATDPARLHRPLPLTDIRDSIVPYRANRRTLQLESSEDYELVLMQLCAGEGGFARTEPEDVRALFVAELGSANPDLALLHLYENAVVSLEAKALAMALSPKPELAFAPPDHMIDLAAPEAPPADLPELSRESNSSDLTSHCAQCGGLLPPGRVVNFCPHCGGPRLFARCSACRNQVEAGWRHCVSCGAAVMGN